MTANVPQREQWWCPDCQRVLRKPPLGPVGTTRYHSVHCATPMRRVNVSLAIPGPEETQ